MPTLLFQERCPVSAVPPRLFRKHALFAIWAFLLTVSIAAAQVQPTLTAAFPQGGQQGQNVAVTLTGTHLGTATAVWFSGTGITAEIKEKTGQAAVHFNGDGVSGRIPTDAQLVASLTIAPDAPLGIQQLRIISPYGVSNAIRFVVGDLIELMETDIADPSAPLTLPVTLNGTIASIDDEDRFTFPLEKGARLICEVTAQRIGSQLDSYLVLRDAAGAEVANSGLGNAFDSVLDYTAPETGIYTLHIRDIRYKGGPGYTYRLSIGELPYLKTIFPIGGGRGSESSVAVTGANLESLSTIQVSIDADTPAGTRDLRVRTPSGLATNPHPFAIGSWAERVETEPNNARGKAMTVTTPITINGRINAAGDVDWFAFEIVKPQLLVLEVEGRNLASNLDALLTLYGSEAEMGSDPAAVLSVNDDAANADARIDWNFQTPGTYAVALRDLNNGGGDTYPYRFTIRPLQPSCDLSVVALGPQNRPAPMDTLRVSRGSSVTLQVNVTRLDRFRGPIRLQCPELPDTFAVSSAIVDPVQNQGLLTVSVPSDAPLGLMPFSVVGVCAVGSRQITRTATPAPILLTVMDTPEFTLTLTEIGVSTVHNKMVPLHVSAKRRSDFAGPIALSVAGLPNRVSVAPVTIGAGETEATLSVKAGRFERREEFSVVPTPGTSYISVTGTATVDGETVKQSTPAIPLTIVEAPFIVTVEPLRFSIVFPAAPAAEASATGETLAIAGAPPPAPEPTETAEETREATLTLSIVRQGGFTDAVTLTPIDVPEGLITESVTIPQNETEVDVPLQALRSLPPETYQFKFRGTATINSRPFEQDSPILRVKIIH